MNYGDTPRQRLKLHRVVPKVRWEARRVLAPLLAPRAALHNAEPFDLWGEPYLYFVDAYNMTWRNERAVELAVAKAFVATATGRGLEFGNVLAHYGAGRGELVLDKYERAPGVVNEDIVEFAPTQRFDYIVSVSTLEHVGWDERPRDITKVDAAFRRLVSLLAPGGRLLVTAPTGHHPGLDAAVLGAHWPLTRAATLVRTDQKANLWRQADELQTVPYEVDRGRGADGVWVLELTAPA